MRTVALIVAAGAGNRFGATLPKQYLPLEGKPVLTHSLLAFEKSSLIDEIFLVVAPTMIDYARAVSVEPFGITKLRSIVAGGETRSDSVQNGLRELPDTARFVAIHDGARPLISVEDIAAVVGAAVTSGAAILARPLLDTLKRIDDKGQMSSIPRDKMFTAETPQVFACDLIRRAHEAYATQVVFHTTTPITDDAQAVELLGGNVTQVTPVRMNPKITKVEDLRLAEMILQSRTSGGPL